MNETVRKPDEAFGWAGDEFAVILRERMTSDELLAADQAQFANKAHAHRAMA
jgi:hypothetical protein